MLKYCLEKWNTNKNLLEAHLRRDEKMSEYDYSDLVRLVVEHILNRGSNDIQWNTERIETIDHGDYQGTLLFVIPERTYQPSEYEYLMTYIGYGSCSVCDYLQSIRPWENRLLSDKEVKDYMGLCKDILTNMTKPYNDGWRDDDRFATVTME